MKIRRTEITTIQGDITKIDSVEAIVNAANSTLLGGGGVDGAIHRAAGRKLFYECLKLHGCRTGEAKLTGAHRLPCQYIIHTVGPVWHGGQKGEADLLKKCYLNSLQVAVDYGIRSIAFPSISTGAYSYPVEQAAKIATEAVHAFVREHPDNLDKVMWVFLDDETKAYYDAAIEKMGARL